MASMYWLPSVRVLYHQKAGIRIILLSTPPGNTASLPFSLVPKKTVYPFHSWTFWKSPGKTGILVQYHTSSWALFKDKGIPSCPHHWLCGWIPNHKALCPALPVRSQMMLQAFEIMSEHLVEYLEYCWCITRTYIHTYTLTECIQEFFRPVKQNLEKH